MQTIRRYVGRIRLWFIALLIGGWLVVALAATGFAAVPADEAWKVAVDASGNVYVTGSSWNGANMDYLTIKYDAGGVEIWRRFYNGPANQDDAPRALAVDASGNLYVTGDSWNGSSFDWVTIKYDTNGVWLWGRRYNSPANLNDIPVAVAVDAGGNVYVTGNSFNSADWDYVTIKYDANGTWLWGRRYNGPINGSDTVSDLAVDASGNVLVTGGSQGGWFYDYVTIKYSSSGTWLWGRRYNGPLDDVDNAKALAVDASGNVLVTGWSASATNFDYVTIKYDTNGAWLWGRRYDGGVNGSDEPFAIAVDQNGNVCVHGDSWNGVNTDYVTIKYNSGGAWVWGRRYNGSANGMDSGNDVFFDNNGNACVTGSSSNGANKDYVTIKYDTNGGWLWGQRYNGPANGNDYAYALAVDTGGNVYVTGYSYNAVNADYVTIKYSVAGTWLWGARYDGPD